MARKLKKLRPLTKLEQIQLQRQAMAPGIYPGMGRARTFADRKHRANKQACRGRVAY